MLLLLLLLLLLLILLLLLRTLIQLPLFDSITGIRNEIVVTASEFKSSSLPFVNTAGANFADVILRSLFGFAPKWAARVLDDVPLTPALGQGGFVGRLDHLRTPAGLASVESDGTRLVWALEARGGAAAAPHASGGKPPARRRRAIPAGALP